MNTSYDRLTKYFHWIIAIIIAAEYALVWLIPEGTRGPTMLASYHESFGVLVLVLMLARIGWQTRATRPPHPAGMPHWQVKVSAATHGLLYLLLVLLPFTGWLWTSARGWQITLFGVAQLPQLISKNAALGGMLGAAHEALATAVLVLVALHAAAALYHWIVVKDRMMQSMWP